MLSGLACQRFAGSRKQNVPRYARPAWDRFRRNRPLVCVTARLSLPTLSLMPSHNMRAARPPAGVSRLPAMNHPEICVLSRRRFVPRYAPHTKLHLRISSHSQGFAVVNKQERPWICVDKKGARPHNRYGSGAGRLDRPKICARWACAARQWMRRISRDESHFTACQTGQNVPGYACPFTA